ncbi:hypothetical protein CR513_53269, partial [Mucuna pruriens]
MKVYKLFECYDISEKLKVKLVTLEFNGYALVWWYQVMYDRLYQGFKGVGEYFKEMEICMMKAEIEESQNVTMVRFLHGLNMELQDLVELHQYGSLEDHVHQATKVKSRIKRKLLSRKSYPSASWEGKEREKERPKGCSSTPSSSSSKSSSIKCFNCFGKRYIASQCPNRRTMILKESGEVDSESSQEVTSSLTSEESSHVCFLIIDGRSNVNVTSLRLVEKLTLPTCNLVTNSIHFSLWIFGFP